MKAAAQESALEGFPLSPCQERALRLARAAAAPRRAGLRVALEGPLERDALERALRALAAREEILRTGFAALPGSATLVQVIAEEPALQLSEQPLAAAPAAREREARELLDALVRAPEPAQAGAARALAVVWLRGAGAHELLLAHDAACADAASLWILVRRLLGVLAGGAPAPDAEGAPQYADLAQWMLERFDAEDAPEGLGFWRRVPPEAWAPPRLSFERAAPRGPFRPERVPLRADLDGLRALAARAGVAAEALLLALWRRVLALHADHGAAALGWSSPGRGYEGLDDVLGPFRRTLPIALALEPGASAPDAARAAASALERAAEQHELFDPERLRPGEPVALALAFEHHAPAAAQAGALRARALERREAAEPFLVRLVWDEGGASELALWHDAARLPEQGARVLAGQLETLVASALADPERPLAALALVSSSERERLVAFGRGAPAAALPDGLVHRRILAQARATPEAIAVACAEGRTSYAALVARAQAVAARLQALGVGPGQRVGIAIGRSSDWCAAMLGVLLCGAAYVPLPPGWPPERLAAMLADGGARVVLTRHAERASLPAALLARSGAEALELDALAPAGAPLDGSAAGPDDLAYVLYTSGSTGAPKGVAIPHAALAASTAARAAWYRRSPGAFLLLSSFAFDSSVAGVFWTLCAGGTLVLPAEGEETDLGALAGLIERERVTHTLALPALWSALLEETDARRLRSLGTVIVAGEACPPALVARHQELLGACELHDEYGPTEGTVWCSAHDCSLPSERASVPIGRPIAGARLWVVDERGALAPLGAAGELLLGGAGVARGYLDDPERTAERFVQDTFGGTGGRLYRTGDRVRWQPDGTLEFLGRADEQVKIRGQRVEPGEVEAALRAQPDVREALVGARDALGGEKELVAWVVRAPGAGAPSADTLRERLGRALPPALVPAQVVLLEALPRLPNGKVDRARLPAPAAEARAAYRAPATPLERVLAELWAEALDREPVGVDDDFFLLGGHSIVATRLFARITDALGVRIALRALFERRTIAELAAEILRDPATRPRVERTAELLAQALDEPDGPG